MKIKLFTIKDSKSDVWERPFVQPSRGHAIRSFTEHANNPDSQIGRYPEDFTLFEIGQFDEDTATIEPYDAKIALGLALDFKKDPVQQKLGLA